MCDFSRYGGRSDEWLAVEKTLPPVPPLPKDAQSLIRVRDLMNEVQKGAVAEEMKPLADKVTIRDHTIPTRDGQSIEARSFRPAGHAQPGAGAGEKLPVYMHMHGGGFIFGTVSSDEAVCARIASGLGAVVLNVNYRHTPEAPYPAAWDDAEDAFAWLHAHLADLGGGDAQRVVVGGTSAGAHLAASLTLRKHVGALGAAAQACPPIAGQVLMIPLLVHKDCHGPLLSQLTDPSVSSYTENADAPILSANVIDTFVELLKIENADPKDLKINPGNASAEQVKGLPPTTFGIAGLDPLRDEGLLYAKLLSEAGVPTTTHVFKGVPHGFRRFKEALSEAKRWDRVVDDGIKWALERPQATGQFVIIEE